MNGRPIPGFYWDPEKKKYFRVQANHVAPAGSQYSREAVKRRKLDNKQRQRQIAIDRRVRRERVQISRCMDHAFTRLTHEIGKTPIPGFAKTSQQGRAYISQLERRHVCNLGYSNVVDFARHGPSGVLVAAVCMPSVTKMTMCPPLPKSKSADVWEYDIDQDAVHTVLSHELSSISICDSGYFLATYIHGISGDSKAQVGCLPDPNRSSSWTQSWSNTVTSFAPKISPDLTYWCSAARPNSSSEPIFAVGTSDGLQTIRVDTTRIDTGRTLEPEKLLERENDVHAVEWLSRTVIASGFRDELLFLSDLRSNDSVQRIEHTNNIAQIRKIDDNRLVVAGNHSLRMYDLRFPKAETKTGWKHYRRGTWTKPYLVFDNYNSEVRHSMDINTELGLLASVTPNRQEIRFYSLADGSILPPPISLRNPPLAQKHINRIWFEEYEYPMHQQQAPRLLYAQGPDIVELAW